MKQVLSKMSFDFVNQANLFLRKCDGNYLRLYLRVEKDFSKVSHGYTTLKFVENFNETSEKVKKIFIFILINDEDTCFSFKP